MLRTTLLATLCASSLLTTAFTAHADPQKSFASESGTVTVTPVVEGLDHPWALAFLPDKQGMLVTERPGNLRTVSPDGKLSAPLSGVPQVWAKGQGGLLDVVLSPSFGEDRLVYLSYAEGGEDGKAGTTVGRGRLSDDLTRLTNFEVIFRQQPKLSTGNHFGSRLVFDRDGYLFIALGENNQRPTAQDLDKLQGKVVRIYPDGRIPDDNPFVGNKDARPEIWSYGQRNQQGAALNPWTGTLWTHEHGPKGGDEINLIERGKNYGCRWRPTALTTLPGRFPRRRAQLSKVRWGRITFGRNRQGSVAWPFTIQTGSSRGSTTCLSVPWPIKT